MVLCDMLRSASQKAFQEVSADFVMTSQVIIKVLVRPTIGSKVKPL